MGASEPSQLDKAMIKCQIQFNRVRVLFLGQILKENCLGLRNARVVVVVAEIRHYGVQVGLHDPWVDPQETPNGFGLTKVTSPKHGANGGIVLAVAHDQFRAVGTVGLRALSRSSHVFYGLKHVSTADGRVQRF